MAHSMMFSSQGGGRRVRRLGAGGAAALLAAGLLLAPAMTATAADEPWMNATLSSDERADLLAAAMTLDQKVALFSPDPQLAIPELGIPGRREIDGGTGITTAVLDQSDPENTGSTTTAFPSALSLASTWSTDLAQSFGRQGGREAWLTGYSGWAGPAADPLRNPFSGRQWASFGEDPVLAGVMPAAVTAGINENEGVYSLPKHWLVNDQETQRRTLDNVVDERALREFYVRQWEPIIDAGPGAVMCAFPQLDGAFACENPELLTDILKDDLGFEGWVSSDFDACYTYGAFAAGADVCGPSFPTQAELKAAVEDGTISSARFDDMVHRILRTFFERGLMDNPAPGSLENPRPTPEQIPADVVETGRELAYDIAVAGSVLLKNDDAALPLSEGDAIALIGEGADRYIGGFGADYVRNPTALTTMLEGISSHADVTYVDGVDPARVADLMPGMQPIPSSVLTPAMGTGAGLSAQWFFDPAFTTPYPFDTGEGYRVEDQINWGNGLAGLLALFGAEAAPTPKVPAAFVANDSFSIRWTGTLNPTVSGDYDLGVTVLGDVKVYLDDDLILDESTDELTMAKTEVSLDSGSSYDLRVDYVTDPDANGTIDAQEIGPAIRLSWAPPVSDASPQIADAVAAAEDADVAIVVANDYLGESLDRGHLGLPQGQDDLIEAVAAVNPNTIVVLTTAGAVEMPWLDEVAGVVEAWYPGQEQGRAVADLLFGDADFTGRLPLTWPTSASQVTDELGIDNPYYDITNPGVTVDHAEGIYVGYRGYEQAGISPLFSFGYGLSYSEGAIEYRNIQAKNVNLKAGKAGLVRVQVRNSSSQPTTEVVQVYGSELPTAIDTPEHQLLGWSRVTVPAGKTIWVDVPVDVESPSHPLAYWSVQGNAWVVPTGATAVEAGGSLGELELTSSITVR